MPQKWVNILINEYSDAQVNPINYTHRCRVSDPDKIKHTIIELIRIKKADDLKELLTSNFICPVRGTYFTESSGDHHTRTYQRVLTRPVIEALFIKCSPIFREILTEVINSNDEMINEVFLSCCELNHVDLPKGIFDPLSEEKKEALAVEIQSLSKLNSSNQEAQKLAVELEAYMENWQISHSKLMILQYKMQFIDIVHRYDQQFAKEPNYKKIFVNIVTILFSGGVINLIHWCCTGNFLFFKHTPAQNYVANIDKIMGKDHLLPISQGRIENNEEGLKPGDVIHGYHEESSRPPEHVNVLHGFPPLFMLL